MELSREKVQKVVAATGVASAQPVHKRGAVSDEELKADISDKGWTSRTNVRQHELRKRGVNWWDGPVQGFDARVNTLNPREF